MTEGWHREVYNEFGPAREMRYSEHAVSFPDDDGDEVAAIVTYEPGVFFVKVCGVQVGAAFYSPKSAAQWLDDAMWRIYKLQEIPT